MARIWWRWGSSAFITREIRLFLCIRQLSICLELVRVLVYHVEQNMVTLPWCCEHFHVCCLLAFFSRVATIVSAKMPAKPTLNAAHFFAVCRISCWHTTPILDFPLLLEFNRLPCCWFLDHDEYENETLIRLVSCGDQGISISLPSKILVGSRLKYTSSTYSTDLIWGTFEKFNREKVP